MKLYCFTLFLLGSEFEHHGDSADAAPGRRRVGADGSISVRKFFRGWGSLRRAATRGSAIERHHTSSRGEGALPLNFGACGSKTTYAQAFFAGYRDAPSKPSAKRVSPALCTSNAPMSAAAPARRGKPSPR